eukprot:4965082-Amphidinium_carterae.1
MAIMYLLLKVPQKEKISKVSLRNGNRWTVAEGQRIDGHRWQRIPIGFPLSQHRAVERNNSLLKLKSKQLCLLLVVGGVLVQIDQCLIVPGRFINVGLRFILLNCTLMSLSKLLLQKIVCLSSCLKRSSVGWP